MGFICGFWHVTSLLVEGEDVFAVNQGPVVRHITAGSPCPDAWQADCSDVADHEWGPLTVTVGFYLTRSGLVCGSLSGQNKIQHQIW